MTRRVAALMSAAVLVAPSVAVAASNGLIAYWDPDPDNDLPYVDLIAADGTFPSPPWKSSPIGETPSFSPDGNRLAYADGRIYVAEMNGGRRAAVTRPKLSAEDLNPTWSPDGRRIAFERDGPSGDYIEVVTLDGSGVRRIARGAKPAWSYTGRIAFTRRQRRTTSIYVIDTTGATERVVTGTDPAWAPDASHLIFARSGDLFSIALSSRTITRLTSGRAKDSGPAASPDGTLIAFSRDDRLELIPSAGGPEQKLKCLECYDPDWQPRP